MQSRDRQQYCATYYLDERTMGEIARIKEQLEEIVGGMGVPISSGGPVSIPLVGDSTEAKTRIAEIIASMDLEPIDVGPLRNARHVEGLSVLLLNNAFGGGPNFEFHLRQYPRQ